MRDDGLTAAYITRTNLTPVIPYIIMSPRVKKYCAIGQNFRGFALWAYCWDSSMSANHSVTTGVTQRAYFCGREGTVSILDNQIRVVGALLVPCPCLDFIATRTVSCPLQLVLPIWLLGCHS